MKGCGIRIVCADFKGSDRQIHRICTAGTTNVLNNGIVWMQKGRNRRRENNILVCYTHTKHSHQTQPYNN